jgi:hypothetical protein
LVSNPAIELMRLIGDIRYPKASTLLPAFGTAKLANEITIDVKENVEAIDRLIKNIDKRSVLSGGPRSPFGWINPRHKKSSGRRSAVGNIRHGGTHLGRVGGGLAGPEQCAP